LFRKNLRKKLLDSILFLFGNYIVETLFVVGIFIAIYITLQSLLLLSRDVSGALFGLAIGVVIALIGIPIVGIILSLFLSGIGYLGAKVLGGQGTFENHYYHFSIFEGGLSIVSTALSLIPCVGIVFQSIIGLYGLYPTYLIYKGVHSLSNGKALFLTVLPVVLLIILAIIAVIMVGAALGSLLTSLSSSWSGY
jgi:hypothetical protein